MAKILAFLNGKKTYIVAVLFGVFNVGLAMGWWAADNQMITLVDSVLGTLGLSFLRAGVTKSGI